jgi:hypothetical protein
MACCAIKKNLKDCRNWSTLESEYCHLHQKISPELLRLRWVKRFILGYGAPVFSFYWPNPSGQRILDDIKSGRIVLTKDDLALIPKLDRYLDIYVFLVIHNIIVPSDNVSLHARCLAYFTNVMIQHQAQNGKDYPNRLTGLIAETIILGSGELFYTFLMLASNLAKNQSRLRFLMEFVPTLLDSGAAKELSWFPRDELDKLRLEYEKVLGADHPLTKCLVQRWLLDLKELYQTEKAIQKLKMDQCKEQLMMDRWHPDRLQKYLDMGYEIDQLDDIM